MKKITGFKFLLLALGAFAGLAVEGLYAYLLEPAIYNAEMSEWTTGQDIIHWIITCVTWGIIALIIIKITKKKYQFDLFEHKDKMKAWQWIVVAVCIVTSVAYSYYDWGNFKFISEFQHNGWLKFIFQYLYYIFETVLFTLIIIFGQKACELWFKKENFPYGGIVVALTWGLGHILTKNLAEGLATAALGFMLGSVYLLVNRDIKKALPILFIMFVL